MKTLILHSDGGARGNPGPAAAGVFLELPAENLRLMCGKYLGENTNNFAEYQGVILGFERALALINDKSREYEVKFFLDSALIVNQLNGKFKLKASNLIELFWRVRDLEKNFARVTYTHVPREKNKEADRAVNLSLDRTADFEEKVN